MEIFLIGGEIWQVIHWHSVILVLLEASANISQAVLNLKKGPQIVLDYVIKAKKAENHIEHLYHEALASLFKNKDTIYILDSEGMGLK